MTRILLLAVLITLCSLPTLAKSAYEDGVALYNKHAYAEAVKLLYAATLSEHSNDAVAHYYLANTLLQLHQNDAAKAEYTTALKLSPTGALANYCRTALNAIPGATKANPAYKMVHRSEEAEDSESTIPSGPGQNVDDMVELVKATDMHPELTADFIANVKAALSRMPSGILQTLRSSSCKIVLTPTMIDKYPELKNEKPRGYDAGGSYKNCPAMFDEGAVNVCEYYFDSDHGQWHRQPDPINALKHEIGHALDAYLGHLSEQQSYIAAYQADFAKVSDADKRDLSYYCYNDSGGHSETFAEITSALLGARSYSARKLANCFPHTTENIRQYVGGGK